MGNQPTTDEVLAWVPRLLLRRWRDLSARARRLVWVAVGIPVLLFVAAAPAYADGSTSPSALSWIKVKDSHGVSIWQYEMSLDRGGVTDPVRAVWAVFVDLFWQIYRGSIAVACWLVDWTLSMDWVGWVAQPVMNLSDGLHQVVTRFGATTALLTMTALVAVLWMARGRWVLGIFELFMSLFIASLAIGILANPVKLVAGDGGLLMGSRDVGMSVAAGLQDPGSTGTSADQLRTQATGMLAETFLRKPQQLVNFGEIVDGTKCQKKYDEAVKEGPYGDEDNLRDAVGGCDDGLGEVAENPNAGMFMSLLVLMPAGLVAVAFAAVLCGVVLIAGIYAFYQSLKMIVALVMALLPGGARGSLWMTFAELIISMVTIAFSIVFLAAYLMLIQSVFTAGESPMSTFFVVDVLLLVGIIVFLKGRKRIKAAADRLAQAMAKRPGGGGASALPGRSRIHFADAYYKSRMAIQAGRIAGSAVSGTGASAGRAVGGTFAQARKVAEAARRRGTTPAPSGGEPIERLRERLDRPQRSRKGQLVRVASQVGLAAVSGGTSAVATVGTRTAARQAVQQAAISGARRLAVTSRTHLALPAGPTASGSGSGPNQDEPSRSDPGQPRRVSGPKLPPASSTSTLSRNTSVSPTARPTPAVIQGQVMPSPASAASPPGASPLTQAAAPSTGSGEAQLRSRLAARRARILLGPGPSSSAR